MITYRKLIKDDKSLLHEFILKEGKKYYEFLEMGWTSNQIINQLNKETNFSYGAFYNKTLTSFILGDLFNIEKISEYEILLIYVSKCLRKNGLATKLIHKIKENNNCLKKIYLEVSQNNNEGISFYKKMKFKIIDKRKNYFNYNEKKVDALIMSKNI